MNEWPLSYDMCLHDGSFLGVEADEIRQCAGCGQHIDMAVLRTIEAVEKKHREAEALADQYMAQLREMPQDAVVPDPQ